MNKENIKLNLDCAFINISNILPYSFQQEFTEQAFIAGGCIYSLYNNKPVNDYDFFLKDERLAFKIINYFKPYVKIETDDFSSGEYEGHSFRITKNAISFDNTYQIVSKFIGEPWEVVNQFDFKHNMFAYRYKGNVECFSEWEFLTDNTLHFNEERARDLCGVILRLPKFINKGFNISKSETAKILKKLNEQGFTEREEEIINDLGTY